MFINDFSIATSASPVYLSLHLLSFTVSNNIIRHNVPERIMFFIWLWKGVGDKTRHDNPERIILFIWLWKGMMDKPRHDNPEHDMD